jgi:TolB-like protein
VNLQSARATSAGRSISLELPDRAAVAVLPFANMSSDPEQEYFAEGLAEDLEASSSVSPIRQSRPGASPQRKCRYDAL